MRIFAPRVLVVALAAAAAPAAYAQESRPPGPEAQKAAMSRLDAMVGDWKGEGWIDFGRGQDRFRGSETVQQKLGGVALLVEGNFLGQMGGSGPEVPVHTTLGVISFDPKTEKYRFTTWLASGTSGEHELRLTADGWTWEIETPRFRMRYVTKLTPDQWFEIGERSMDEGKTWQKFFEMTLKKKP